MWPRPVDILIAALIFVICISISGCSIVVDRCLPKHCNEAVKFTYEPGWSYIYDYEANVVSSISGTSEDFTSIFVESQLELHVVEPCQFQLKLRNVNLRSRDVDDPAPKTFASGHAEFQEQLEAHLLRFTFDDGHVGHVCADPNEKPWVLNVKKAIVSAFQNTAQTLWKNSRTVERDVLGDCVTEYQVDFAWTTITMTKTKDLEQCRHRNKVVSGIQSTPYDSPPGGMVSPALRSNHVCQQVLDHGIFYRISCSERHMLRAFSSGTGSGAQTITKLTLVLTDQIRRQLLTSDDSKRFAVTTLLFDHDYEERVESMEAHFRQALDMLSRLCLQSLTDTPRSFWGLCRNMRSLDYQALTKLFNDVDRVCGYSARGQKVFRDALPYVGTVASVTLMRDLILDHSVSQSEVTSWVTSLAFYSQPTLDVLKAALPLLTSAVPSTESILSLSALVHSYCHHPDVGDCQSTEEVDTVLRFVEDRLGHTCHVAVSEEPDMMVTVLKALGNMGRWRSTTPKVLESCIADRRNPTTIRLEAVKSYRRVGCQVPRKHLSETFADSSEDVEVRIAAYLATIRCPDAEVIEDIVNILKTETLNQVNSFVWSHLSSIRKSSSPEAKVAVALVADIELQEKYATDVRKFSQAYEASTFSEILNVGINVEGHVVHVPQAFLPRSAMLNVTVNLFGQSVNLVEIEGRAEGLERFAESLFRPEPLSPSSSESEDATAATRSLTEVVRASNRAMTADSEASVALKVFGQEVWYARATDESLDETVRHMKNFRWSEFLGRLSEDRSVELMRDAILIELGYVVPTVAGLPLALTLNATGSVHVKIGGHLDIRDMAVGECDIEGIVRPSVAMALQGSMMVSSYVGTSGVKLEATMTMAPYLDGKVKLTGQGQIKVHLNVPSDRMDLILVSSDLVLSHWGKDRALRASSSSSTDVNSCSTALTGRSLGVELCVQLRYANASLRSSSSPHFPLTGPLRIGLWMHKTDPQLTSYHVEYLWDTVSPAFLLSFRTPRSSVDREWTAEYAINGLDKSVVVRFITPYKKIIVKGRYFDDPTRRGILANVDVDGGEAFSFQCDVTIDTTKEDHVQYQPRLLLQVPTHTVLSLYGQVRHEPDRYLHIDMSLEEFTISPIIFRGELNKGEDDGSLRYESSLISPMLNFSTKGYLNTIEDGLSSKTSAEYQCVGRRRETIDVSVKLRYTSPPSRSVTWLSATLDFQASAMPGYNSVVTWDHQSGDNHLENVLTLERHEGQHRTVQVARFQQILSYNGTVDNNRVVGKLELKVPTEAIFFLVGVDHQNNDHMLHSKWHLKRSVQHDYGLDLRIADESSRSWQMAGHVRVSHDGHVSGVSVTASEGRLTTSADDTDDGPPHYVLQAQCFGTVFHDANVSLNYTNRSQRLAFNHGLRLSVVGPHVRFHAFADLLLTDSRGLLMVDADVDDDRKYRFNADYSRLKRTEHDVSLTLRTASDSHSGRFLVGTGPEKTLAFDVRSPGTRKRLEGSASLLLSYDVKSSSLHLAWDQDVDPSRTFNFSVFHERRPEVTNTKLDLVFLLKVLRISLDHRQQGSFQVGVYEQLSRIAVQVDGTKTTGLDFGLRHALTGSGRQFDGGLRLLAPLQILFRELDVNVSHHHDDGSWRSIWSALIDRRVPLQVSSTGKSWRLSSSQMHAEATAEVRTSGFPESLVVRVTHDMASSETRSTGEFQWSPRDSILVRTRLVRPRTNYEFAMATVNVTTPFEAYRKFQAAMKHSLADGRLNSHLRWTHDDVDTFCLAVDGGVSKPGHHQQRKEVTGTLRLVTPLKHFEDIVVGVFHWHDGNDLQSSVTVNVSGQDPVTLNVQGSRRPTGSRFNVVAVAGGQFGAAGVGGHLDRSDSAISGSLNCHYRLTAVNTTFDGYYNSLLDLGVDAVVATTLPHLERTSLSLKNKVDVGQVATRALWISNDSKTGVDLNAKWTAWPRQFNVSLEVDSPLDVVRHALLKLEHHHQEEESELRIQCMWNDKVSVQHTTELRDNFNFNSSVAIDLPFDFWDNMRLTVNQSRASGGLLRSFLRLTTKEDTVLAVNVQSNHSRSSSGNRRNLYALVTASSDLLAGGGGQLLRVEVNHRDDGSEYYPVVSWTLGNRAAVTVTGYARSLLGNKMIHLIAKSNIPGYEVVTMSGLVTLHDLQMKCATSVKWSDFGRLEVEGEVHIDLMAPRLKLSVVTPWSGYRNFRLDGSYDAWTSQKQAMAMVIKENWSVSLIANGIFQSNFVDSSLVMETSNPYSPHLIVSLNATGVWNPETRSVKVGLYWDKTKAAIVSIAVQPPRATGTCLGTVLSASFNTLGISPHFSNGNVIVRTRCGSNYFSISTTAAWNEASSVDGHCYVRWSDTTPLNLTLRLASTVSSVIPSLDLSLVARRDRSDGGGRQFHGLLKIKDQVVTSVSVEVEHPSKRKTVAILRLTTLPGGGGGQSETSVTFDYVNNDYLVSVLLKPPGGTDLQLDGTLVVPDTSSSSWHGHLGHPGKNDRVVAAYHNSTSGFQVDVKTTGSPLPFYWNLTSASLQYRRGGGGGHHFVQGSLVDDRGQQHNFDGQWTGASTRKQHLKATVESPVLGRRTLEVSVHKDDEDFRTSVSLEDGTALHTFHLIANDLYGDDIGFDLAINSPLLLTTSSSGCRETEVRRLNVVVNLTQTTRGVLGRFDLVLPCVGRHALDGRYERDPDDAVSSFLIDIVTPLETFRRLRINTEHEGHDWDNVAVSLDVVTPIEHYEKFATSFRTVHVRGTSFDVDVFVDTPFKGYENISLSESVRYALNDFLTFASMTNVTYDGVVVGFGGKYARTMDDVSIGLGGHWQPFDPYSEDPRTKYGQLTVVQVDLACSRRSMTTKDCDLQLLLDATPWQVKSSWTYAGWRKFLGHLLVTTPFEVADQIGVQVANDLKPGSVLGLVGLQWSRNEKVLLHFGGNWKDTDNYRGNFNLSTPFALFHQARGHAVATCCTNGMSGNVSLMVNDDVVLDGVLDYATLESDVWKNRSVVLELHNIWQPFGVTLTSSVTFGLTIVETTVVWDTSSSVNLFVEVGSDSVTGDKLMHLRLRHPKHEARLSTTYRKTESNFTHAATLDWGARNVRLVSYKVWRQHVTSGHHNGGLRWTHPGRTLQLLITDDRDSPVLRQVRVDFWWDVDSHPQEKHVRLDLNCTRVVDMRKKRHELSAVLSSAKLRDDVRLEASASQSDDTVDALLRLCYSSDPRDLFQGTFTVTSSPTWNLSLRTQHARSELDSGVVVSLLRRHPGTSSVTVTFWRKVSGGHDRLEKIDLVAELDVAQKKATVHIDDEANGTNVLLGVHQNGTNNLTAFALRNRSVPIDYFVYQPENPSVDANFSFGSGELLRVKSGLTSPTEASFVVTHCSADGRDETDARLVIKLNTSRLFTLQCLWSPNMTSHVQAVVAQQVGAVADTARGFVDRMWSVTIRENLDKSTVVWNDLVSSVQPALDEATSEVDALRLETVKFDNYVREAYFNNDFFVRDVLSVLEKWDTYVRRWRDSLEPLVRNWSVSSVAHHFERSVQAARTTISSFLMATSDWSTHKWHDFFQAVDSVSSLLTEAWLRLGSAVYRGLDYLGRTLTDVGHQGVELTNKLSRLMSVADQLKNVWATMKSALSVVSDWIRDKVEGIYTWLVYGELSVVLHELVVGTIESAWNFLTVDVYKFLEQIFVDVRRFMSPKQQQLMDSVFAKLQQLCDVIWNLPDVVVGHVVLEDLVDVVMAAYHKVLWLLRYTELSTKGWTAVTEAYNDVVDLMTATPEEDSATFDSQNFVLLSADDRKVEIVQHLPFPWKNFRKLPDVGQMDEIQTLYRLWKRTQAGQSDEKQPGAMPPIFVWWNYIENGLDVTRWLPPFEAQAMLAGRQHYVSFDGRVTEFVGRCSYLLTKDFLDGNFSVAVNYDDGRRSSSKPDKVSLTVTVDGHDLEILRGFQVLVDGKKVELPQAFGHTHVFREVNFVTLRHDYGFVVSCHMTYDVCTFTVSGWYLGRLYGLLGSYDYERADDVSVPNGTPSDGDVTAWGNSWRLGSSSSDSCHGGLYDLPDLTSPGRKDPAVYQLCATHFNSSSSMFRHCYHEVDPSPFLELCLNDVESIDRPQDICTSAAAYIERCRSRAIPVRIPKVCVRCSLSNGLALTEGEAIVVNSSVSPPKKADVVIIVEAKRCNKDLVKVYSDLVAAIDRALKRAGVGQRRFATVLFGGSGVHDQPYIQTFNSQIFVPQRVISGLHNLVIGRGVATVFDAFRFASKLPFQPGASKTFVLVACSIGEDVQMKTDYPEVHWLLLEDGITLHLLIDREFDVKKPEGFYGVDREKAFTAKDARSRDLKGDSDLRRQVAPPKDFHVPIALEVNGTVFSNLRLYDTKSKKFLDVFSRRLAQSAAVEICHNCECFPDDFWDGRLYCQPCIFPRPFSDYENFPSNPEDQLRLEVEDIEEEEDEEDIDYDVVDYDDLEDTTKAVKTDGELRGTSKQLTKEKYYKGNKIQ